LFPTQQNPVRIRSPGTQYAVRIVLSLLWPLVELVLPDTEVCRQLVRLLVDGLTLRASAAPRLYRSAPQFEARYITDFRADTRPRSGVGCTRLLGQLLVFALLFWHFNYFATTWTPHVLLIMDFNCIGARLALEPILINPSAFNTCRSRHFKSEAWLYTEPL
jgi:hypothetical protein